MPKRSLIELILGAVITSFCVVPGPGLTSASQAAGPWAWGFQQGFLCADFRSISVTSGTDIFVVGGDGSAAHDDGTDWTPIDAGTYADLEAVWCSSSSDAFAVGEYIASGSAGVIAHYDGNSWTKMNTPLNDGMPEADRFYAVWGSAPNDVFAVGGNGIHTQHHRGPLHLGVLRPRDRFVR